eukprot:4389786-Alexandrium_andersonii.AAC.1
MAWPKPAGVWGPRQPFGPQPSRLLDLPAKPVPAAHREKGPCRGSSTKAALQLRSKHQRCQFVLPLPSW